MTRYWKAIMVMAVTVAWVIGHAAIRTYLPALDAAVGPTGWQLIEGALILAGVVKGPANA